MSSHVRRPCRQTRESRRQHDTYISDVYWHVDPLKEVPDETRGDHQTGIDSSSDRTSEGVPCAGVEPVPELLYDVSLVESIYGI
jgi:hypothetical protein